ncbi:MAG: PilW family protein [Massilia sp.]
MTKRRGAGFSMVELLVALAIGMLAMMFATRVVLNGEQNKQASLGGSDAMQNGMLAMFSISADGNQAGYGLNDPLITGCNTVFSDTSGYTLAPVTRSGVTIRPMSPVIIESNGSAPDRITFYAGSSMTGTGSVGISSYPGLGTINISAIPFAFNLNDVILVAADTAADGTRCAISQITTNPGALPAPPAQQFLRIDGTGRFTSGTLGGATFGNGISRVFNLGPASTLAFHSWSVVGNYLRLQATDLTGSTAASTPVIDNVVSLKAQYGFDTRSQAAFDASFVANTGVRVNQWSATMIDADGNGTAASHNDFQHIVAIRLAVVARSKSPEKPDSSGNCNTTTVQPKVFSTTEPTGVTAVPIDVDVSVAGETVSWKCYRYRVFETIVPLRNAGWRR